MGVVRIAPGLGYTLAIISFPAALHTIAVVAHRKRRSGHALSVPEKILAFIGSLVVFALIVVAVWVAAIGALFVICLQSTQNGRVPQGDATGPIAITVASVLFIGLVIHFLIRGLWRTKD
jgi:hypothetical protein